MMYGQNLGWEILRYFAALFFIVRPWATVRVTLCFASENETSDEMCQERKIAASVFTETPLV